MPKPRSETWQTCATPATPLQRGAFLDLCTEWLVSDPEHAPAVLDPRTCVEPPATHFDRQPFARTRAEVQLDYARACTLCGTPGAHAVVANPFAQRYLVLVCATCAAADSTSRFQ